MLDKHFILHLSLIDGIGPSVINTIVCNQRSDVKASDLYSFSAQEWKNCYGISDAKAYKIVAGLSDKKVLEAELNLIARNEVKWLVIGDDRYPSLLAQIYMPPPVLYWRGGSFDETEKHLAIVGARAANMYGQRVINQLIPELVSAGLTIVSGGALGIDALAHEATIKSGGKTIVVLGAGLLRSSPASNRDLFKRVVDSGGLVVSSFSLLTDPLAGNFPARNRIIAGLSHGCLVVQAAQKSGALITAHYALEQGREVFSIPGAIDDPLSVGCHELIQRGAKLVKSAVDIIEECGDSEPVVVRDIQTTLHDAQQLIKKKVIKISLYSDEQQKIMNACQQSASLDDIVRVTDLPIDVVQSELFNLQLDGKVSQDFIGMWVVVRW